MDERIETIRRALELAGDRISRWINQGDALPRDKDALVEVNKALVILSKIEQLYFKG